jgi:ionotropic glutamate receptor
MLKSTLLILLLINDVHESSQNNGQVKHHEIIVGVIVTNDNLDIRTSIHKALLSSSLSQTTTVKIKELILKQSENKQGIIPDNGISQQISTTTTSERFNDEEVTAEFLCEKLMVHGPLPTVVIDTTEKGSIEGTRVKEFLKKFGVPTLSLSTGMINNERSWSVIREQEKEWLLQINPPVDVISTLASDLVLEYGLKNIALLYDSSFLPVKNKFEDMTRGNEKFKISPVFVDQSPENIKHALQATAELNVTNYIVMAGMTTINKILESAQSVGLLEDHIAFYLVTKSRGQLRCPSCRSASVLLLQATPSTNTEYNHTSSLQGVNAENKLEKFFYYDMTRFLIHTINDLINTGNWPTLTYPPCEKDNSPVYEKLTLKQLKERSELSLGTELSVDGFYGKFGRMIFDDFSNGICFQDIVMKVTKVDFLRGQIYNSKQGEWTFGKYHGDFMYGSYLSQEERTAIAETKDGKKKMTIVMYLQPPFIMKKMNASDPTKPIYYGYCIDLLDMIRVKMANKSENKDGKSWEWDYELYEVPDGRCGEKKEDGSWTGVIGEVAGKKADIGLGPIAVMAERETVVDFTVPYYDLVGINILMKKPAVPSHLFKFLTVLENNVWYSILVSYFIVSTIIFVYDRISPYSYYNNKEGWADQKRRDFSFKESLWFCMTSLTPQGGGEGPQNLSGRVASLTWWTFGFVVISAYTANLAAFLTVSRLDSTVESLEHLSHQFRIRYATQENTESLVYFKRMSYIEEKFYQIWKNMSLNQGLSEETRAQFTVWDYPISNKYTKILAQMHQAGMPKSYEDGVNRVRRSKSAQEGFAFIADAVQVKYAIQTHCDLYSIGNEFSRKPIALVVQQNSSLKDALSSAILKLLNERKLEKLKEDWWKKFSRRCEDIKKSSDGISIHNIGGVFIVIFAGVILACITLFFEWIFLRMKKNNMKNNMQSINNPNYNLYKGVANAPGTIGRTH